MTSVMENMPQIFSHQDLISIISEFPTLLGADTSGEVHQRQFPNGTLLGTGAFGEVYKGRLPNGTLVAIKVLKEYGIKETFTAEAKTMFMATHRNLVKLYGFCSDDDIKALVYELMAGSLDMVLYKNDPSKVNQNNLPKIEWEKLYDIAIGIAEGLSYLHDGCHQQIIHHDVKPANVLLDMNCLPKLTDFGVAKHMNRDLSHFTGTALRGTPGYIAPEVGMSCSRITYTCDVYSYGKMLFEILARKRNSENQNDDKEFPEQVWDKYEDGHLEELITSCGIKRNEVEKARTLTMVGFWCIQFTPEARPTMRTVINWLEKVMPVPAPSNPFFAVAVMPSPPPSTTERMFMKWWFLLLNWVAVMFSKVQTQKSPSLEHYMVELLEGSPDTIYHQLRMRKHVFIKLCELFRQKSWLQDTEFTIQEKIAIFLMKTNPRFSYKFQCSSQKMNQCFYEVLHAMLKFSKEMIVTPDYDAPVGETKHCRLLREGPFKGAVGALDGTVIYPAILPRIKISKHCHNVLGVCDFDMKFVYVMAGFKGVAHDSRMLDEALRHPNVNFPLPPPGKYYLYDSLCTQSVGFLSPYRNTRYRLQDFLNGDGICNKEEEFNHAHAQLRNVIERAFGVLKARFPILNAVPPYYHDIRTQKNLVLACIAIHNFVRNNSRQDKLFQTWKNDDFLLTNDNQHCDPEELNDLPGEEPADMVKLRKEITDKLTADASFS